MSDSPEPGEPPASVAPRRRRWVRRLAVAAAVLFLLVGAAYAVVYAIADGKVPARTTVLGVAIGGLDPDAAERRLADELRARAEAPITLVSGTTTASLRPAEAGLGVDYAATVDASGAATDWRPSHIVRVLRGGEAVDPVVTVDDRDLRSSVADLAQRFSTKAADASVSIKDAEPVVSPATPGHSLDVGATAAAVRDAYLKRTTVTAVVTDSDPELTTEEAKHLVDSFLAPALASPITLTTPRGDLAITPAQIAAATSISADEGDFSASTDPRKLWKAVQPAVDELGFTGSRNARFTFVDGRPHIVESTSAEGVDERHFAEAVAPLLEHPAGTRTAKLTITRTPPEFTTEDARRAGVKEITGEFTTWFPYAEYRNVNLTRAASAINGSYLAPGETFSLNETLGERTTANGYVDGWVIIGDHLERQPGGGISQSATTTFNAIFFAGLEDVEHHPHTMYFDRYPAGREATVYYGKLDLRFRNNTDHGVLMQAFVKKAAPGGRGSITVRVWSTKTYDVRSTQLVKSNFVSGRTLHRSGPTCHAQDAAPGFTVKYSRLFYRDGRLVKSEPFSWRYSPQDRIICD